MVNFFAKKESAEDISVPKKRVDFNSYVDPTGEFDSGAFGRSLWMVRHRVLLYRLGLGIALVVSVVTWLYVIVSLGYYAFVGLPKDQLLYARLAAPINFSRSDSSYTPAPYTLSDTALLPSGSDKVDAVAALSNPNERWLLSLSYTYAIPGVTTTSHDIVVLPGAKMYLAELGLPASTGSVVPKITNVHWEYISNHTIPDMTAWLADHLNFTISTTTFEAATGLGNAGASIRFTLTNSTAYNFRNPQFIVGFMNNGGLVGVVPLSFNSLASLETKAVDLRSFVPNINVDSVEVVPLMNVFSNDSYSTPAR